MASKKISELDDGGALQASDLLLVSRGGASLRVSGSNVGTNLANTGVTPGSYTNASITVDAKGRITLAANGTAGGSGITDAPSDGKPYTRQSGSWVQAFSGADGDLTGKPTIPTKTSALTNDSGFLTAVPASGVTAGSYSNPTLTISADGRVTAAANGTAGTGTSLPNQTGQAGKFLTTDGTAASWAMPSGGSGGTAVSFVTKSRYWRFVFSNYAGNNGTLAKLKIYDTVNGQPLPLTVTAYSSQFNENEPASAIVDYTNAAKLWSAATGDTRPYVDIDLGSVIQPKYFEFIARTDSYANQTFKYCDVFTSVDATTYVPVQSITMPTLATAGATVNAPTVVLASNSNSGGAIAPVTGTNFAVRFHAGSGSYSFSAAKIEFLDKDGNVVPAVGGTPYARGYISSTGQVNTPDRAFDGDPSTWWEDQPDGDAIVQKRDTYIGYIFPSPVQVSGFRVACRDAGRVEVEAQQVATLLSLQVSSDSKVFSTIQMFATTPNWNLAETRTFMAPWSASTGTRGGGMVPPPVSVFASVQGTAIGASPNVRYSRGISSVIKQSDGVYRITFSQPFNDLFYAVEGLCRHEQDGGSLVDAHLSIDRRSSPNSGKNLTWVDVVLTYQGAGIYDPKIIEFWMRAYDPRLHM